MATMAQSTVQAFPSPLFPHPGLSSSTAAALAPGEGFLEHHWLRIPPIMSALPYYLYTVQFCFTVSSFDILSFEIPSCV